MAQKKRSNSRRSRSQNVQYVNTLAPWQKRLLCVIGLFLLLMGYLRLGIAGIILNNIVKFFFGQTLLVTAYLLLIALSVYILIKAKWPRMTSPEIVGLLLILLGGLTMCCYQKESSGLKLIVHYLTEMKMNGGGFIGVVFYGILSSLFASTGALWASILMVMIGLIFVSSRAFFKYREYEASKEEEDQEKEPIIKKPEFIKKKKKEKNVIFPDDVFDDHEQEPASTLEYDDQSQRLTIKEKKPVLDDSIPPIETKPVKLKNGTYQLPSYKLLNPIKVTQSSHDEIRNAKATAVALEELLQQFGVNVHVEDLMIGPTVTKYELRLEIGTRVNKILSLQDDIQLALAAKDIRIEAPIPGKPFVGIEVPNKNAAMVPYNEIFQLSMQDESWSNKLAVPLGKDVSGQLVVAELNKMPHLLIAGATGSGKSVCVNSIITSILMKSTPDEVRMILVDPKKVELSNYNGVPHLLSPVVTDPKKAAGVLQEVVQEMEHRYEIFAANNKRNMGSYNAFAREYNKTHDDEKEIMPYIVVILDEVADLMMVASKTVEDCIMRISQMARAAGIHMIVATQRPSTDIITGVIKANIPSRIAFAVSSSIDSRTILDTSGAEKLLGKGDMLFSPMGSSSPIRVQGAFVDDAEVARVVDFVSNQMEADYDEKFVNAKEASGNAVSSSGEDTDEEYEECRSFVIQSQKASTSLLQRKFRIGYNKAARIMEQLEENGVIGPQIGSKPREVYIKSFDEEDDF